MITALIVGVAVVWPTGPQELAFVDLLDENGASVVPMGLVNEIGPFDGSRAMTVPDDGIYLFSVQANGPWTITVD